MFSCFKGKQKAAFDDYGYLSEKHFNDYDCVPDIGKAPVNTTERLAALRAAITDSKIDCYVIPSGDAHGSEYVARKDRRQEYISGFTGESSMAIVSQEQACLFVDGRYHVSAGKEIDENWTLYKVGLENVPTWSKYLESLPARTRIGLDATLFSITELKAIRGTISKKESEIVLLGENLIDSIWQDRPDPSRQRLSCHANYAGEASLSKLEKVRSAIKSNGAMAYVVHELSEIAWTLNLRGKDIPFSPVFESYLLITLNNAILFLDRDKVTEEVGAYLRDDLKVDIQPYQAVWQAIREISSPNQPIALSTSASFALYAAVGENNAILVTSPLELLKSIKNETEIRGMKAAYLRDAMAWVKWIAWLEKRMKQKSGLGLTEYDAANHLTKLRANQPLFAGLAYQNISATGPNAALPHYSTDKAMAVSIDREDVYLNDSGAQYLDGTIDTTRTYHFGKPKPEHKRAYTRVLQGHIHASEAIFPEGTTGAAIDALARAPLWKDGYNFLHGTGHGIGSYLNVHEGPQRIAAFSSEPLRAGQFVSIEPGYYEENHFGIRIESIYLVKEVETYKNFGHGKWLGFERITQIPIDVRLIDWQLLSKEEKKWLIEHNRACADAVLPLLDKDDVDARKWLRQYL